MPPWPTAKLPEGADYDGLLPNAAAYALMTPLAEKAIAEALAKPIPKPAVGELRNDHQRKFPFKVKRISSDV